MNKKKEKKKSLDGDFFFLYKTPQKSGHFLRVQNYKDFSIFQRALLLIILKVFSIPFSAFSIPSAFATRNSAITGDWPAKSP